MSGEAGFVTSRLDEALGWARKFSIFQYPFVTACCGMEYMATACAHYDVDRFGAGLPRFSPRQADVLFVVGTISHKMAPVLKRIYDQMAEPKWVVSFGVCTCTGGFYDNYATVMGIDTIIPVDVYIPGCPPRPEYVLDGLLKLQAKIQAHPGNTPSPDLEHRPEFERASGPASGLSPLPFSRAQKPDPTGQVSSSRGTQP
jgi:NADH-quinone oxidoreductase subunit B